MRSIRDYLEDLQAEVNAVERFTRDGKDTFMEDERNQYAVMMAYARIGEIVKRIPDNILETQPHIEWRDIKGFRDVLLHRYFDINVMRVWQAVEKVEELQSAVRALLDQYSENSIDKD